MNFKGMRLTIVVLTLALTLALLFGARWLYRDQALSRPLEQAVRAVPGVAEVALAEQGETLVVKVKAGDVPRLEDLISGLWQAIDGVENRREVRLEVSDSRNQTLLDIYYEFHFYLQEAVATGRYSDLPARLEAVTAESRLTRERIFVGSDYVYVQLHQGEASLYEIVPRHSTAGAGPAEGAADRRSVAVVPWESGS